MIVTFRHLPVNNPNTSAATTRRGKELQNGVRNIATAAINMDTLFNIRLFTLFKSASIPETTRPIVFVIPRDRKGTRHYYMIVVHTTERRTEAILATSWCCLIQRSVKLLQSLCGSSTRDPLILSL